MGDDSERADPASGSDAGTSDGGSSGGDESGSDAAAGTPSDADDSRGATGANDTNGDSDATGADANDTDDADSGDDADDVDNAKNTDDADNLDSADDADDGGTFDDGSPADSLASDVDTEDGDGAGGDSADDAEPPEETATGPGDADESGAGTGVGSAESRTDESADREDLTGQETDDGASSDADDGASSDADDGASSDADDDSDPDDPDTGDPDTGEADDPDTGEADDPDDIWPDDRGPPADAAAVTGTDGGTPAAAGATPGAAGSEESLVDDGIVSDGPESDEEMPLADHIEEMIRRLAVVLGVGGVITLLLYPGADLANSAFGLELVSSTEVIDFLWNKHVPGAPELTDRRPRVYGPLELLLTELKVAALGGLVVGLPVFVYETYLFMRPGLYPKERRYYLAAVPTSLILAFVGISFAHFVVLPAIFAYFTSYTTGTAIVAFGLKETFNLILILMGYNAIIFQIPLFIMLAIMMNLVTRTWLEDRRLLFWGAFLGLAFLVSPDPTGMAPIIIGATMIALFEGTLLALRWTRSGNGAEA